MLSTELNETLTQIGPGTQMGTLMRRYWLPALLSSEAPEPDGPPVRVRMLGEDLVAFRDSTGQVGLIEAYCPHRRAPMFFGRNEEAGLRCVYHGWKFDVGGNCVDMPSEPPGQRVQAEGEHRLLHDWEGGGVVWAFWARGGSTRPARLRVAPRARRPTGGVEDAGARELPPSARGRIDTAHSSFVHNNELDNPARLKSIDVHPKLEVDKTDYGFRWRGIRRIGEERQYVRAYHFMLPAMQMRAALIDKEGEPRKLPSIRGHIWVPVDDDGPTPTTGSVRPTPAGASRTRRGSSTRRPRGAARTTISPAATGSSGTSRTTTSSTGSCRGRRPTRASRG